MVLSWLSSGPGDVGALIAKKSYARAAKLLREQLEKDPSNVSLELQLADVLQLDGQGPQAAAILVRLADGHARHGFLAKAIALLKKVQRLDPERGAALDRKIATLAKERDDETARRIALRDAVQAKARPASAPEPPSTRPAPAPPGEPESFEFELSLPDEPPPTEDTAGTGLEKTPLFSDFSGDELVEVIRGLRLRTYGPGDVVVAEGEPGDSLFVITTGSVKVFCRDPQGRYRKVREMGEGSFFGEVSILTGEPRSATITAGSPLELLELDVSTLESIAEGHPRVLHVLREFSRTRAGSLEEIRVRMGRTAPPPSPSGEPA
jgi:cAMP-dependent protein kinase regulator